MVYEGNGATILHLLTPEGYLRKQNHGSWEHIYQFKDHLGSVRYECNENQETKGSASFYASGVELVRYNLSMESPYRFAGNEYQQMHGLNLYDVHARFLDVPKFRWDTMDPLCEMYYDISPYVYCGNNPVKNIDPDGRWILNAVGAVVNAAIDYGSQVAVNLATGNGNAFTDVNVGSILVSAVEGAINPVGGVTKNIAKNVGKAAVKTVAKEMAKEGAKSATGQALDNAIKGENLTNNILESAAIGSVIGTLNVKPVNNNAKTTINKMTSKIDKGKSLTKRQTNALNSAKSELKSNKEIEITTNIVSKTSQSAVNEKIRKNKIIKNTSNVKQLI